MSNKTYLENYGIEVNRENVYYSRTYVQGKGDITPRFIYTSLDGELQNISSLVLDLMKSFDKFRFYDLFDVIFSGKGLVFRKDFIFIPYVLPSLPHEIGHILEMKDKSRWVKDDLGMPMMTNLKNPAIFYRSMARDFRARAIQLRLGSNDPNVIKNHVEKQTIDSYEGSWFLAARDLLPYGRFRNTKDVADWANTFMLTTFNEWTEEKIRHEWSLRIDHYKEWMETK